jgi:hypothetical protein
MTAVEFLIDKICGEHTEAWKKEIKQALEMEKQQIIDSYKRGWDMGALDIDCNSEKYYSETFKSNNP